MQFGTSKTGDVVEKLTIGAGDLTVSVLTWGAIVQDVRLRGVPYSLTLGSDTLADYEDAMMHHGSLIGPIANRISNARIKIDGMMYELERNQDDRLHLHSGKEATHRRQWALVDQSDTHVTLNCTLGDGACGLPGNRSFTVTYRVEAPANLTMELHGTTDTKTAMNFANHSYWNLDGTETWAGHALQIAAKSYLPSNEDNAPTGEIVPVAGTQMDFRQLREVTPDTHPFDNNFCLATHRLPQRDVLILRGASGVQMTLATTEPGVQVYDGRAAERPGRNTYEGLAIEAQCWPDAPNHVGFPSILMGPDEPYAQTTTWRFEKT